MRYSSEIVGHLQQELKGELPGLSAQMRMAPPARNAGWVIPDDARKSAVLVLLYPGVDEAAHLVLMKRTEDGRTHGGQISFPGGRWEETDRDFVHTALREAEEEVGVPTQTVEVIGQLSELYIPPSNFLVFPTVAITHSRPAFVPDL